MEERLLSIEKSIQTIESSEELSKYLGYGSIAIGIVFGVFGVHLLHNANILNRLNMEKENE